MLWMEEVRIRYRLALRLVRKNWTQLPVVVRLKLELMER
jgi:hypothetical protein